MSAGTIPFVAVGAGTSYGLLAAFLVIRGIGLGGSMMPAMAAAYATLRPADVPRATSALNAIQRVGGSIGTALLAVVLQHEVTAQVAATGGGGGIGSIASAGAHAAAPPVATAFAHTFWWALGLSLVAVAPAATLAIVQRRQRGEEVTAARATGVA